MQGIPIFIAVVTQVAAVLIFRLHLCLILRLTIASRFLLPSSSMMASSYDVHIAFASDHTPFFVLTVLQTKSLQFVPCGIRIAYC